VHALLEDVLPFVLVFYVAESVALVGPGESLFVALFGRFRALGEGLHLAALTPWASSFSAFEPDIRWNAEGVQVGRDDAVVSFTAMETLTLDRHWLSLTRGVSVATPSSTAAETLHGRLMALRDTAPSQRSEVFARQCTESHDLEALRARLHTIARWSSRLRPVQTALFALGFGGVPAVLALGDRSPVAIDPILWLMLLLFVAALGLGYKLLRATGAAAGAAIRALSGFVLFPPGCLHLFALVARPLLSGFAPLAVAAALLPLPDFRTLARQRVRRLENSGAKKGFEKQELDAVLRLIAARGLTREEALLPPAPSDATAVSYCPLCSEEYRTGFDSCADCGAPLEPVAGLAAPTL